MEIKKTFFFRLFFSHVAFFFLFLFSFSRSFLRRAVLIYVVQAQAGVLSGIWNGNWRRRAMKGGEKTSSKSSFSSLSALSPSSPPSQSSSFVRSTPTSSFSLPQFKKQQQYVGRELINHSRLLHPHVIQFREVFLTDDVSFFSPFEKLSFLEVFFFLVFFNPPLHPRRRCFDAFLSTFFSH